MKKHMIQVIKLFFFVAVSAAVYEEMDNTAEVFLSLVNNFMKPFIKTAFK